jgi:glycerol-3-phosphate acyltransferase PlsX
VDRPALAAAFPNMKEKVSIVLDVGANVDSKPEQIEQFAVMGEIYYRAIWGTKAPRSSLAFDRRRGNVQGQRTHARSGEPA